MSNKVQTVKENNGKGNASSKTLVVSNPGKVANKFNNWGMKKGKK